MVEPAPVRFAVLGADGDLTVRLLLPALAELIEAGRCGPLEIRGVGLGAYTAEGFRERVAGWLEERASGVSEASRARLLRALHYTQGDVTDAGTLRGALAPERGPLIAYLALPPAVFAPAVEALVASGVTGESRVVVEKPHGQDLASTRALNGLLHAHFPEAHIFRMDHFLGKQTVQNILGLRFANRMFEPLWNAQHVARVEVRWDETLTLEGRANYYDRAGALVDMLQNHLLQLACLVGMEPPRTLGERDLRDKKLEFLRAVRALTPAEARAQTVRARYTSGRVGERAVPSYEDEGGVKPERHTETFAQVALWVDNWRWAGVPFVLRSGKALGEDRHEIVVHFREVPFLAFGQPSHPTCNILRLRFNPDRLELGLNLNGAGDPFELEGAALGLTLAPQRPSAYARLLQDILEGDPALTIRADEAEEAWRIVMPILEAWRAGEVPMQSYPAGSDLSL